ncbi:SprB repeat-containing protein [Dyadobacter jiangsuensis]|uniref:SprB repeat-containing protein n=1 Tax=Dyadobacter jiangsuensis TaxID=1591085 RepID=UPI001474E3B9|nr:SprB repeat-containing protein [Dyadobacter jiangsuensis]
MPALLLCAVMLPVAAFAQNKLFMNPVKYTDRQLEVYGSPCGDPAQIHLLINGAQVPASQLVTKFIVGGYYAFEMDFGLIKPGDTFRVTDDCGSAAFQQTVKDDYVYVEVAPGAGHNGNGIGPADEYPPYSKLSTPLQVGKCSPINIDSHGQVSYYVFSPQTNGKFLVNGAPLTNGPTGLNPGGYEINFNGYQGTPTYTINADGSITSNTAVKLESNTHFSGQVPVSLEYRHGGVDPMGDLSFGFKAMAIRQVGNSAFSIEKAALGGNFTKTTYPATPNTVYKVTYDGVYYRAYADNVLIDELRRFVEYGASSGSLNPGSGAGLDYSTPVTWTGMSSGAQWVSVLVDGVLYTRQQFQVAADIIINPTVTDVACTGSNTGQITVGTSGGLAPLQYTLNSGAYVASDVFSGLAAGTYQVHVRDASGCTATRSVTVGSSTPMQVSVASKTDESCAGAASGSVTIQASGGAAPYLYAVGNGAFGSNATFPGLSAGAYSFSVKDNNGCVASVTDTIKTTSKLLATIASKQDVSCFGGATGSFVISTAGSVVNGALSYSSDNGGSFQASPTFAGLAAGTYKVVVKDNACSVSVDAVIAQPAELLISAALKSAVSCNGLADGVILANASGGTAPYQFSINGTQYAAAESFTGLAPGNYKVWVKDAAGCIKESAIVTVTEPGVLSASVTAKTDVSCFGGANGSLTLAGAGGTQPYTYAKDSINFQTFPIFSTLSAGTTTFILKDANGCKVAVKGEILSPSKITLLAAASAAVSCFDGTNGQITAAATGGSGVLQYSINGTDFSGSPVFSGLKAGDYQVTARDGNGCTQAAPIVSVTQPTRIEPAFTKTNVKCFGNTDGSVGLTATGGTGAYTFSKDSINYQAAGLFAGLSAGSTPFFVKDANSCVRRITVDITQPSALAATTTISSQVLCYNGNSGMIQTSASGGTAPYQYSINGTSYQTPATFSSLVIGTYKVWVKDAQGCLLETPAVTLTQPTELLASVASQTAVKCFGGSDGSVTLAASGGVSPYRFSRDSTNFQSAPLFPGLPGAQIRFTVKDANGCTKPVTATVAQPAQAYTVTLASQANLGCYGNNQGMIQVKNNGGTAPYQVSLDNTQFQGSEIFNNLSAGTYSVFGKDANGCTFTLAGIALSQPTDIVVSLISKKDVDCEYYETGEAQLSATGSAGGFTYTLTGTDFKFRPVNPVTSANGAFDDLMAGDYTITAQDQSGCKKEFALAIVPKNSNIRYDVSKTLPTSCNSQDGSISIVNANGGRPPYQYSISSQNSFSDSPNFTGLLNGTYIVTVADELCSYKKEVDLTIPGGIKATYSIAPVSCSTPVASLNITGITGGSGSYQLSLNGGAFTSDRSFTNLHPNVYSVVIQDNPLSCKTVLGIEIKEQNRADLTLVSRQNVLCYGGNTGVIAVKGDNNVGPFTYAIGSGPFGADGTFNGLAIGTYNIYAKNSMGCLDSLRVTLTQPSPLTSTFTKTDNSCNGDKTGSIELIGSGGTPAYTYSLNGTDFVASGRFNALTATTYHAAVKDANGCVSSQRIELIQPSAVTVVPVYQDTVRCYGESNGVVEIAASGGTPDYSYSINGNDYLTDNRFAGLPVGKYKFSVKDSRGCAGSGEIQLSQPEVLTLALASKSDPLCFESKDGVVTASAKGGNGGYQYTLDNGSAQAGNVFQGLGQGQFAITVTDRRGCKADMPSVSLKWPEKIVSTYSTAQPVCFGQSSGSITLDVKGGTPGYKALFNGQNYNAGNGIFKFASLASQTYPVEITDSHGCIDKLEILLSQPEALDGLINITNNKCFGDKTGQIAVTASGGAPGAYQFAFNSGAYSTTSTFAGLVAGSYSVNVKDAAGCTFSKTVSVVQPSLLKLAAMNQDTVRCYGEKSGSIRIAATGGTPVYRYSLDGAQYYSDSLFTGLAAGDYKFWVKDAMECQQTTALRISQPEVLDLSLMRKTDPLCAGEQNGTITLAVKGGNGGYSYQKDNTAQQSLPVFERLSQGEYTFKVTDRKGCQDTVSSVRLVWPKALASQVSWKAPVCAGEANGSISVKLSGGTMPYNVTMPAGTVSQTTDTWNVTGIGAGKYAVQAKDANGCVSVSTVSIAAPDQFDAVGFPVAEPVCKGQEVILQAGNAGKSTVWYYKEQEITQARNEQTLTAVEPGTYKLVISNSTGCSITREYTLINNNNALKADFLMTVQAFVGDTVRVLDISQPTPDEIEWQLPGPAEIISNQITRLAFAVVSPGEYPVKMIAKKGDCINTKIRNIKIFDKDDIDQTDSLLHYQDINVIQEMVAAPNPNFGRFTVTVKLAKTTDVSLAITNSTTNALVLADEKKGQKDYVFDVVLTGYEQDTYIVTVRAGKSVLYKRVLILN